MPNSLKKNVTRRDIARRVWLTLDRRYTQEAITEILKALWEVILDILYEDAVVYINDKFSISCQWHKPRKNYNPVKEECETLPGGYRLKISPHQYTRDMLEQMAAERTEENEE